MDHLEVALSNVSSSRSAGKKVGESARFMKKLREEKERDKLADDLRGASKARGSKTVVSGVAKLTFADGGVPLQGRSIGSSYGNIIEQLRSIKVGLPTRSIASFQKSTGLPIRRITELAGISTATYSRRKQGGRLSAGESERMFRLSRVFERAIDLHQGDKSAAMEWLETPIESLGGIRPLDMTQTEPGAREVDNLISRIQHGVVS